MRSNDRIHFLHYFLAMAWVAIWVTPVAAQSTPPNFQSRREMRSVAAALNAYLADHGALPPVELEAAGEFISSKYLTTPIAYTDTVPTDWFKRRRQRPCTPFEHFLLLPRIEKGVIHLIALTVLGWYVLKTRRDASNVRLLLMVPVAWLAVCAGAHYFFRSFLPPPISVPNEHWIGKRFDYQIEMGHNNEYILLGVGPDGVRNLPRLRPEELDDWVETNTRPLPLVCIPYTYDPTNGSISSGDIIR